MHAGLRLSGRFALEALLGRGGMGEVWRGVDEELGRPVAVKVLREHFADPGLAGRLRREAAIAARVRHPGITTVYDIGSDDGRPFIVMELLHGRDLEAVLAGAPSGLPVGAAVSLVAQAAGALQAAHAERVVHRDIKPSNLFVQDEGPLKICDFGIALAVNTTASLSAMGAVAGTPAYMSPEQCQGLQVDERSDLYSLGCVLYALLAGRPPFPDGEPLAVMYQHVNKAPEPLRAGVSPELDHLVMDLLAKDPASRPSSAGYVAAALKALPVYTPTLESSPIVRPATIKVGESVWDGEIERRGAFDRELRGKRLIDIAITPDGTKLYVVRDGAWYSDKKGGAPHGEVFPVSLPALDVGSPIIVDLMPTKIVISPDGTTAYVAHGTGVITPIDVRSDKAGKEFSPCRGHVVSMAFAPNGETGYLVCGDHDVIHTAKLIQN